MNFEGIICSLIRISKTISLTFQIRTSIYPHFYNSSYQNKCTGKKIDIGQIPLFYCFKHSYLYISLQFIFLQYSWNKDFLLIIWFLGSTHYHIDIWVQNISLTLLAQYRPEEAIISVLKTHISSRKFQIRENCSWLFHFSTF